MGEQADKNLTSFKLNAGDAKKNDVVKNRFENPFITERNVIFERAKFNQRFQGLDEPVDKFITSLHTLAEHCNFGALSDQMIRDRIVVGLADKYLSENLQLDSELILQKATDRARQSEAVKRQKLVDNVECVANKYPNLFKGLGKIAGEYKIKLKQNAIPYSISAPRKSPIS